MMVGMMMVMMVMHCRHLSARQGPPRDLPQAHHIARTLAHRVSRHLEHADTAN
jgi:hypothetical protein